MQSYNRVQIFKINYLFYYLYCLALNLFNAPESGYPYILYKIIAYIWTKSNECSILVIVLI